MPVDKQGFKKKFLLRHYQDKEAEQEILEQEVHPEIKEHLENIETRTRIEYTWIQNIFRRNNLQTEICTGAI